MTTLIQYNTDKFIQSLHGVLENSVLSNIDGILYALHFQNNFDNIVFVVSGKISTEVNNFIIEFQEAKNIVLYYINTSEDYSEVFKYVKHVTKHGGKLKGNHTELPDNIVDTQTFVNNQNQDRKDKYCVLLNNAKALPDKISCLLYPSSSLPINMFSSPYISHAQNLGMLTSESEKCTILNTYKYFINTSNEYIYEAQLCGCVVVDVDCDTKVTNVSLDTSKITPISEVIKEIL
tara:strand:- start:12370 stop:13071 length:702 start_codon:yes stop_codon:yes gene_type:complete